MEIRWHELLVGRFLFGLSGGERSLKDDIFRALWHHEGIIRGIFLGYLSIMRWIYNCLWSAPISINSLEYLPLNGPVFRVVLEHGRAHSRFLLVPNGLVSGGFLPHNSEKAGGLQIQRLLAQLPDPFVPTDDAFLDLP